jgi:hypothetical protein
MKIFVYVCKLNFFKYIYVCVKIMSLSLKAVVYGRQNGNLAQHFTLVIIMYCHYI